jgi:uncharacterized membrane protein YoaK (UPF0700 family)
VRHQTEWVTRVVRAVGPRHDLGVPSNRVQIAIVIGACVLLAALDWIINDSPRTAIAVAVGLAVGLMVRFSRKHRQRSDRP